MPTFRQQIDVLVKSIGINRNTTGRIGEYIAIGALRESAYGAKPQQKKKCGDVVVTLTDGREIRIEVKTAVVNKQGKFSFCLTKWGKRGQQFTCCTDSDFVLLLCVTKTQGVVPFLIPATMLSGQQLIGIGASCVFTGGKYGKYRQQLDNLNFMKSLDAAESN